MGSWSPLCGKQWAIFRIDARIARSRTAENSLILGPILFLLYINDIVNVSNLLLPIIFADDTNVFLSGPNLTELVKNINSELEKLVEWLQSNKLSLNIDKTHYMIFSLKKTKYTSNDVLINGKVIKQVKMTKFLGVILDEHLNWSDHVNMISKKIARGISILSCARKVFNRSTLKTLYYSFIYPYMTYCIEVWGSANKSVLSLILKLQKRAVRIISCSKYNDHTDPLFDKLHILKFECIYTYCIALFMFKLHNGLLPPIVNDLFLQNADVHDYFTRQSYLLHVPFSSSSKTCKTLRFRGVFIWNKILHVLKTNGTISIFKQNIKKALLTKTLLPISIL